MCKCPLPVTYPPDVIMVNPKKTHGKYMALNLVPNQKVTITSLLSWHHTYITAATMGSMRNIIPPSKDAITQVIQQNSNRKRQSAGLCAKTPVEGKPKIHMYCIVKQDSNKGKCYRVKTRNLNNSEYIKSYNVIKQKV